MKKTIIVSIVLILLIGIGVYFFYYAKPKEMTGVNKILDNPDEYNNGVYLSNLTDKQKNQVLDSFDVLLAENCKDGKIAGNCTAYFLNSYVSVKIILRELPELKYKSILTSTYLDLKSKYEILTEADLKTFIVPLLTGFCKINIFNETEKISWMQKLVDVNKTDWQSTDIQIYYAIVCMNVTNMTRLNEITGISKMKLNNKICNILPSLNDINTKDLCYVNDYIREKKFCEINSTAEDKNLVNDLLSKEYDTYYQNSCKLKLFKVTNS